MDCDSGDNLLHRLAQGKIIPCVDTAPLTNQETTERLKTLPGWRLKDSSITKQFRFKSYMSGLDFAYAIGKIAQQEDHHPEMLVRWKRVILLYTTHAAKGLTQNDFIMAAKSELEYVRFTEG